MKSHQPTANPAEPVKKTPSAPIKETATESDISSRYEKLFGKNDSSSENSESLDKTESRFEKLFGVKNSTENNENSDNKQTNANNEPKDDSVVFEKPIQNDEENVHNRTPQSTIPALKTESRFEKLSEKTTLKAFHSHRLRHSRQQMKSIIPRRNKLISAWLIKFQERFDFQWINCSLKMCISSTLHNPLTA